MTQLYASICSWSSPLLSGTGLVLISLAAHGQDTSDPGAEDAPFRNNNPGMISARIAASQRAALDRAMNSAGGVPPQQYVVTFDDKSLHRARALGVSIETNVCSAVNSRSAAGGPNVVMGQRTQISCVVRGD
jgi:hypothetical protein